MSDLSSVKILEVTDTYCEVFVQHYNYIEANLNPDLQTKANVRNGLMYAFLVDFALYYRTANYEETYFEIAYYNDDNGEKRKYNGNFYDEDMAQDVIEKVEITEWHCDTPWTEELFEASTNQSIKAMYEEAQRSNELFGISFDWESFLEEVPRNFFVAKVFFKDKKYLLGFEKDMQNATTLDTWTNEWM